MCKISDSHGTKHEDYCPLWCYVMWSARKLTTFRRNLQPQSSELKVSHAEKWGYRYREMRNRNIAASRPMGDFSPTGEWDEKTVSTSKHSFSPLFTSNVCPHPSRGLPPSPTGLRTAVFPLLLSLYLYHHFPTQLTLPPSKWRQRVPPKHQ
jgi:hypothetical protein